jgi:hypothetical protein
MKQLFHGYPVGFFTFWAAEVEMDQVFFVHDIQGTLNIVAADGDRHLTAVASELHNDPFTRRVKTKNIS